jgi:thiol-disulfide isomerase/thioredoxin
MLDGEEVSIDSLRGKTVLINFWATWCPPCNEEMTRVEAEIVERFAGEEFVFLPISRGEKPEVVSAWRTKKGYKFDVGLDIATEIFPQFARTYIPRNYLIDPDGTIVYYEVGYEPELFDELVTKIDETIQNAKK